MAPRKRRVVAAAGAGVLALALYLSLWPVTIDPIAWEPAEPPALSGASAPNEALDAAEVIGVAGIQGPEDVAVAADGRMLAGTHDGLIVAVEGNSVTTVADTGGRPLGLAWDDRGGLIIADAVKGLLRMDPRGAISTLSTSSDGVPFKFTDDVDLSSDGRIYFSDASHRWGYGQHLEDLIEARANGRLLRYDPATKQTETLLAELYFANGVAVAADDSFVLVNETGRYRIQRLWLTGPRAGQSDTFHDNLPGFPDGISRSPRGTFWVALFTVRNPQADAIAPSPFLKKLMFRLPAALRPKPKRYGLVLELDADGKLLRSLHDTDGDPVNTVTSVEEHDGHLYLGTLHERGIRRVKL